MNYKNLFQSIAIIMTMYVISFGGYKLIEWINPTPDFIGWAVDVLCYVLLTISWVTVIYQLLSMADEEPQQ